VCWLGPVPLQLALIINIYIYVINANITLLHLYNYFSGFIILRSIMVGFIILIIRFMSIRLNIKPSVYNVNPLCLCSYGLIFILVFNFVPLGF